ncbi:MAG: serine hydrolase domain-containing protein [Ferruginibacter sp.]
MIKNRLLYFTSALFITGSFPSCSGVKNKEIVLQADVFKTYKLPASAKLSENDKERIRIGAGLFYDTLLKNSGFNGGILVAKGGNIIYENYRGAVNFGGTDSINANTPLHIASVTKTMTAMAILKLQEEGKLNINDTLTKYFPAFNYPDITIKDLLSHRSGLPNYLYFMKTVGWNEDSVIQNTDVLQWLIDKKGMIENIAPPNRRFTYCNTNYALLALVIEKVTGSSFPAYLQRELFDPMGMKNTFVHYTGDGKIRSKSFDWKGREIPDNFLDDVYGDKNVYSTPRDLLIWDRMLSDTGFLSARSFKAAYIPYSNERPGIKNYGLGWRMNVYPDGRKIIFHNGWWHGNNAAFIRLPKEDATIIILTNRYARAVYKAKYLVNLFDHYFDTDEEDKEAVLPGVPDAMAPAGVGAVDSTMNKKPKLKGAKRRRS